MEAIYPYSSRPLETEELPTPVRPPAEEIECICTTQELPGSVRSPAEEIECIGTTEELPSPVRPPAEEIECIGTKGSQRVARVSTRQRLAHPISPLAQTRSRLLYWLYISVC